MIEYLKLYLPKSKKEVKIEISLPRFYDKNIQFDSVYFLDGQNAFKDSHAAFNRAIRATKYMGYMASITNRKILGIAIYNAESEIGRINEYTPFKITNAASREWEKQDTTICHNFCEDLVNTIIPYIEKRYPTTRNRFIYGSSLAAMTAIYLGYQYNVFQGIGAFSTATFLCKEAVDTFLEKNFDPNIKLFLYVGKKESSDGSYDQKLYYNTSLDLYHFARERNGKVRLVVSDSGIHNEATWEAQLLDFFSFMYFDNIIYRS
ncbi:MAG: hypothetical protein K2J85_05025 [Anaeroplasmataceae bacterium]|nr:hypothetical protein [Anaeroplasmataceae bacterium]